MVTVADMYCSVPRPGLSTLHGLRNFTFTVPLGVTEQTPSVAPTITSFLTEPCHCWVHSINNVPVSPGLRQSSPSHSFLLDTGFLTSPGGRNDHVTWAGPMRYQGMSAGSKGFWEMLASWGSDIPKRRACLYCSLLLLADYRPSGGEPGGRAESNADFGSKGNAWKC